MKPEGWTQDIQEYLDGMATLAYSIGTFGVACQMSDDLDIDFQLALDCVTYWVNWA